MNYFTIKIMYIYIITSLSAVILFSLVHLFANQAQRLSTDFHRRFLSMGSGIAIAYVFIDLLPKLAKNEPAVNEVIWRFFPYFERHVYIMALIGFLLFFMVDRSSKIMQKSQASFYLSLSSYALLNILIGYAVVDIDNPEVQPLLLFTIAIGLHYFSIDYSLNKNFGDRYNHSAKYILISCIFLGWLTGLFFVLSETAVALISAFIGGGVIMNVTRHELPDEHPTSVPSFLLAAFIYTLILLLIG
jgi:hypothetical protein